MINKRKESGKTLHEDISVLYFLNGLLKSHLDSLTGKFEKSAKYKFTKAINSVKNLETELLKNCSELTKKVYEQSTLDFGDLLNVAIEAYNSDKLDEFTDYCYKFDLSDLNK